MATTGAARTLTVDKSHSEVAFQVRHLVTRVRGHFLDFEGTVRYNPDAPEQSAVSFTIKTASVDTGEPQRDTHLRSADFFDVEKHPTMTFVSRRIERVGSSAFVAHGDLTIRGITREVALPVEFTGSVKDPWGNDRFGFEAEMTLNRKDFGLVWNAPLEAGGLMVGDEVRITLSLQAVAAA